MKPTEKQKMCPNCDGRIAVESTQCPYCFSTVPADATTPKQSAQPQDSVNYLYNTQGYGSKESVAQKASFKRKEEASVLPTSSAEDYDTKPFLPILLLSLGGSLGTLGILQLLFATNGTIHLEINSRYWFLLLLASAPLCYLGLKKLKNSS